MDRTIPLDEIIAFLGPDVLKINGNTGNRYIKHLRPTETVDADTLDWINSNKLNKQEIAENSRANILLVDEEVAYSGILEGLDKVLIVVKDPKFCILKIGNAFFVDPLPTGIHPTAILAEGCSIGSDVYIGPYCVIGKCKIGDNTKIYPNVSIQDGVTIGKNVIIKAGAVLGYDGFGHERDEHNNLVKFPQLGNLIIEDFVEIGSNTCIDKGSLADTVIGYNTKINNLCHIAHNVVTGKNVTITAQVNISGSTLIGDDVWIAPNASLRGQQRIGKGAVIGTGAVVTKNVPDGETWVGNPAKKM